MLTAEQIKRHLIYDPEIGLFRRLGTGKITGYQNPKNKYLYLQIEGKWCLAHRAAWLLSHGEWPDENIDHINHDKTDNRISNLRTANKKQNGSNRSGGYSSTGYRCVYVQSNTKKYRVRIKNIQIGYFDSLEDAISASKGARQKLFGEFYGGD